MTEPAGRALAQTGRFLALMVTNLVKIGGLFVAIHTAATEANPNVVLIGEACFMMAGAQVSEDAILKLVGRMFGQGPLQRPEDEEEPPH